MRGTNGFPTRPATRPGCAATGDSTAGQGPPYTSPMDTPYDPHRLCDLAGEIIINVRELSAHGWTPATSSNFSRRLDDRHAAISGKRL